MRHDHGQDPFEDVPWEMNPANPKVQETLVTTFEFPITGLELQTIGTALECFEQVQTEMLARGYSPTGGAIPRAQEVQAIMRGLRMVQAINDRLIETWKRSVTGQSVGLGDLPPDPFRDGSGPYL